MNPTRTGSVRQLASEFINRHGKPNVKGIKLPEGDFLIRANSGEMFSSLDPTRSPEIIRLGEGRELYDHGNYIISTVGLMPNDGPWTGLPYSEGGHFDPHNEIFAAFQNHYDMQLHLGDQRMDYLEMAGYDDPMLYAEGDYEPTWDDILTQYRGHSSHGVPETLRRPPDLVQQWAKEINTRGLGERIVENHPSFHLYNIDGTPFRGEAGLYRPVDSPASFAMRDALREAGFEQVAIPSGHDYPNFMRSSGILHWEGDDGQMYLNAYRDGKLIVAHPSRMMPERSTYSRMQGLPFNMEEYGFYVDNPSVPWNGPEIPTLIRTHIYPASAAHDFVPPVDRTWVPRGE